MPRGRSSSTLGLSARREKAKELYARGYTVTDVAREIQVSPDTASRYKKLYLDEIKQQSIENPNLLRDVMKNTIRALNEVDQIRQEAWRLHAKATNDAGRASALSLALKAGTERNKILQLFGVKAEYMQHVAIISRQQERLIEFLADGGFCDDDRARITAFLEAQITMDEIDALPVDSSVTT